MRWLLVLVVMLGLLLGGFSALPIGIISDTGVYQARSIHHPDGIGKFYMGREIAQVMGHQGAAWLERSSRELEERPNLLLTALELQPTDVVADIGAGTGYFSFRLSRFVPEGQVLAVDIQTEMLEILDFLMRENQIENVEPILGAEDDPHLPSNQVDLALMVDAYHEFAYPREMMEGIVQALKPNGRVVLAEYRGENPLIPIKGLHKMTQRQVKRELRSVGLEWEKTEEILPQQHLMFFRKPV
ncbi:class I SAM-dependent methyltransferase [Egbenema bharatensis]|uniref:class I SAM-dependent methyltransferase n=1 Tax=Egbenema bharatensis TaxID=3463334 RepID=UPI003A840FCD